jgi:hypothetical protein
MNLSDMPGQKPRLNITGTEPPNGSLVRQNAVECWYLWEYLPKISQYAPCTPNPPSRQTTDKVKSFGNLIVSELG